MNNNDIPPSRVPFGSQNQLALGHPPEDIIKPHFVYGILWGCHIELQGSKVLGFRASEI